jgi:hypothetical protein
MKKLLFQLDTSPHPAVFDTVVAYDGGADHVIGHGNCTPENVTPLVEGAIFTRAPKEKKYTALFIGGSDMTAGAKLLSSGQLSAKKAVILAGTGPVGRRAAVMLASEGAEVALTSRDMVRAEQACKEIKERFKVDIRPIAAPDNDSRGKAIEGAQIVFAAGAAGAQLLNKHHWENNPSIEMIADANATPPLGIEGTDMMDRGKDRNGKIIWGAIGFGTLKLALHRACIEKLFESNNQVFDAEEIFALAKTMA